MYLGIFLVLLILTLALSCGFYRFIFYSPQGRQNDDYALPDGEQTEHCRERIMEMIRSLRERPFEPVHILSFDNLRLAGRYYHCADGAPLVICFHGYRGTPCRDFSGGAAAYMDMGCNVLMIEQRAHCGSEGHSISFGVNERIDCVAWVQYAADRFGEDQRIILAGISMGAATVLMAAGRDLPEQVRGIVADCPYTDPKSIILKVARDLHMPARLCWPFAWLGALLFGGFALGGADAAEAVKQSPVPILLLHGEDDRFVPCEMSRRIAEANPEKVRLYTFPGAGHGLSFLADEERYVSLVRNFTEQILNGEEQVSSDENTEAPMKR